ncbi:MAG: folate-binding protein YgfZ [Arenicella sp.]|nr:folate-binding protein YgfZ [Arenicella sp.]
MKPDSKHHAINNLSVLKFSGADTLSFLQGQLSNDINALSSSWQYSGYCNPKGRLLALFQVWKNDQVVYATIDRTLVDATVKRLRMYIMRSKVVIDQLETARCTGVIGDSSTSGSTLDKNTERFSVDIKQSIHTLYFGDRALLIELDPSDSASPEQADSQAWGLASIATGEPTIDVNNVEMFVPQMVNLDLLGGINFKKGCYTGQEIVARMHYLGKLKQRMFVCHLDGTAASGDKILAGEKNAGNVVSVANGSVLAVIRRELLDNKLPTESGAKLAPWATQPYSIPD